MGSSGTGTWKDYYQILGIPKYASEEQIKKAYKKLALMIHPDKNKAEDAEERFKEIGEAYEALTDKYKRKLYDISYDSELLKRLNFQKDIYFKANKNNNAKRKKSRTNDYNGNNNEPPPVSCFYPDFQWKNAVQDPPIINDLFVHLEEIFIGCTKKVKINRKYNMNGSIVKTEEKFFDIYVKAGWKAGTKITFAKEGNRNCNRIPADVIFVIKEIPHPLFIRSDCDLKYLGKITQEQALFSNELEVPLISGGVTKFPFTEDAIQEVFIKHFKGLGLPKSKNPSERGDLIAEFHFIFTVRYEGAKKILLDDIREFRQRRS